MEESTSLSFTISIFILFLGAIIAISFLIFSEKQYALYALFASVGAGTVGIGCEVVKIIRILLTSFK